MTSVRCQGFVVYTINYVLLFLTKFPVLRLQQRLSYELELFCSVLPLVFIGNVKRIEINLVL